MFIYLLYFSLNPESACKQDHLLARLKVVVEAISANSKGNSKFHSISFKCKIVMGNFQNFMVRESNGTNHVSLTPMRKILKKES